jgi:hypothetical protein
VQAAELREGQLDRSLPVGLGGDVELGEPRRVTDVRGDRRTEV